MNYTSLLPLTLSLIMMAHATSEPHAGEALIADLAQAKDSAEPTRIVIPKGVYHFWEDEAVPMSFYCSNHDHVEERRVAIPMVGLKDVEIDAQGSEFVFHGHVVPFLLMDSSNITLRNIRIRYAQDFNSEATITKQGEGYTEVQLSPYSSWELREGKFYNSVGGKSYPLQCAAAFHADGRMVALGSRGDLAWSAQTEDLGEGKLRFAQDSLAYSLKLGDILVLRNYARPQPAMLLYRAVDTQLHDVVFHNSQGMALLAQRSENITIRGGGCIRQEGRIHTTQADATHFSNCKGLIDVQGALYEGMMDDAINVHSTCLGITQVHSPTEITARYMHPQAIGFEVFTVGEEVQFIHGPTLENDPSLGKVASVQVLSEREIKITLAEPLPQGIGVGDAIENASWYPEVHFEGNTVRHNRARGALFTTPKRIVVKGNLFDHCSGSAILLAGDAQGWYESGRCLDVLITDNDFIDNLTSTYQFTEGIISIYPEVKHMEEQAVAYHQNIRIEGNRFVTHRVPLIYAQSASGITLRDNEVQYHDKYPSRHGGEAIINRNAPNNKK